MSAHPCLFLPFRRALLFFGFSHFLFSSSAIEPQSKESPPPNPSTEAPADPDPSALPDQPSLPSPTESELIPFPIDTKTRPWEIPLSVPAAQSPNEQIPATPPTPGEPQFLPFRNDPLARNAFSLAQTNAELLLDGLGGIPNPQATLLLETPFIARKRLHFGPLFYSPTLTGGLIFNQSDRDPSQRNGFATLSAFSIALQLGDPLQDSSLLVNYGASLQAPPPDSDSNGFDQSLSVRAASHLGPLDLGLGIDFTSLSGASRDLGSSAERDLLSVALTTSYQLAPKTQLESNLLFPLRHFSSAVSSSGITNSNFVNYQFSPKSTLSLGAAIGLLKIEDTSDQTFEQLLQRFQFEPSTKLRLVATTGLEYRQVGHLDLLTPIFGLGLRWKFRERTQVSVSADRRFINSAQDPSSNYTSTSATLSLEQSFSFPLSANLSLGYEHATYRSLLPGFSNHRVDDLIFAQSGLTTHWATHWSSSLVFTASKNFSNTEPFSSFQASLLTSFSF